MASAKAPLIKKTAALVVSLAAYYIFATVLRSDNLSNILSVLCDCITAGILMFTYIKSDRTEKISITLLLYALACMTWGIADVIWTMIRFVGGSPEGSAILWIIYSLTNCILLISLVAFAVNQFRKWDLVQMAIDIFVNTFLCLVLFWLLFFKKDPSLLAAFIKTDFTSVLSIVTDILINISIYSWLLSVRTGRIPAFSKIISFGLLLFTYADIAYYYIDFNGLYFPNTLIDFTYIFSLAIIAFGALWKTYKGNAVYEINGLGNIGKRTRWIYLLIYPGLVIVFSVTGLVNVEFSASDYLSFLIPILVYWVFFKYVQSAHEKEALLKHSNQLLEQRVAEQVSELAFLANKDTLTALFNRRYFMALLGESIDHKPANGMISLLLIDMDRFKTINDTFGHDAGDRVLIELSSRMVEWNVYGATVARLGGDEFAVLFAGRYTQKDIESLCQEIIDICARPFKVEGNFLNLTMSVGIAIASAPDCDGNKLMRNADIAMYRAKSQGYNRYQVYDPFMSQDFKRTIEIEMLLRQVNTEKDFELYFQPQYSLPDRKLVGAEALIRWNNPEHGYIPPNVFIPIAEQIDYIFIIGKWVMRETVKQSISWNEKYHLPFKIGFNISPKQFQDKNFIHVLSNVITDSGINPEWIDAEVTESIMMNGMENIDEIFAVLRTQGVTVTIDDFGSGFSSLGYLNKYPFDRIKIDKSLIDGVSAQNPSGTNVVRAAINMAHASGIVTIAEGVENQEQLDMLMAFGCDQVQGYLLGRPVPADVFERRYIIPQCGADGITTRGA